jgi:cob(I)alamin adenosyltransferase
MESGFTWDTQDQELDKKRASETWNEAEKFLANPEIDLVVLDEITYMINYNYLDEKVILKVLSNRPKDQHVVITGRAASKGIIEASDTVSEVKDIKHAFRTNIRAQKGIDL